MSGGILGMTHDLCRWCGVTVTMKKDLRLYRHQDHGSVCAGSNEYGIRGHDYTASYDDPMASRSRR